MDTAAPSFRLPPPVHVADPVLMLGLWLLGSVALAALARRGEEPAEPQTEDAFVLDLG